jgi:hypothetical protein
MLPTAVFLFGAIGGGSSSGSSSGSQTRGSCTRRAPLAHTCTTHTHTAALKLVVLVHDAHFWHTLARHTHTFAIKLVVLVHDAHLWPTLARHTHTQLLSNSWFLFTTRTFGPHLHDTQAPTLILAVAVLYRLQSTPFPWAPRCAPRWWPKIELKGRLA